MQDYLKDEGYLYYLSHRQEVGQRFKKLRMSMKLYVMDLEIELGLSEKTILNFEKGKTKTQYYNYCILRDWYYKTQSEILKEKINNKKNNEHCHN